MLLFLFDFVHSHARCGCCSIVCLRFEVMKIKQVDCKMSTKKPFLKKKKTFRDIFGQLTHKIVRLQLNFDPSPSFRYKRKAKKELFNFLNLLWVRDLLQLKQKKSMETQTRLMSWYWKQKPTWRKGLITYNSHLWSEFSFNWYFGEGGRGFRLRLEVQGKGVGRM